MTDSLPITTEMGQGSAAMERPALGPWARALRKLVGDRAAMGALALFLAIVLLCLAAPLYAEYVAHTDPFTSNIDGTITVNGESVALIEPSTEGLGLGSVPLGPTWDIGNYFLGADGQGRDVAARLLYGGRNSLLIAGASTIMCLVLAALTGLVAGFFGGVIDMVISRLLDVLWAFPIYLLAISRLRDAIRESKRLARLMQTMSSTAPTAAASIHKPSRARPVTSSSTGMSVAFRSTFEPACAGKRASTTLISATACFAVTPRLRRMTAA